MTQHVVAPPVLVDLAARRRPSSPALRRWAGLTGMLAVKNFRQRYLRSRLGVFWAILQPTVQAAVLAVVFVKVFKVHNVPHYPLYVLSGIMTWQCFAQGTNAATTSALDNSPLIRKIPLPAVVFPMAAVGGVLLVHLLQLTVLLAAGAASGTLGVRTLLLPLGVLLTVALALGVGTLSCSLHVRVRDVKFLIESGLLVAFYVTPVLYDPSRLPENLRTLLGWNPMYGVMSLQRAALLGRAVDWHAVAVAAVLAVVLLVVALPVFRSRSRDFADLL